MTEEVHAPTPNADEILRERLFAAIDNGDNHEDLVSQFHITLDQARAVSIRRHYEFGRGSIQDYSRLYGIEVSRVLEILNQPEMGSIQFIGDLIDQEEAGAEAKINEDGKKYPIPWDTK
ncbi:MAG TPA: hypothetical protein VJ841_03575 [Candidatus Saccharimonadales bacterium]|nr:hypothetical protein [Candidatus Saccharimonadales bacterium]